MFEIVGDISGDLVIHPVEHRDHRCPIVINGHHSRILVTPNRNSVPKESEEAPGVHRFPELAPRDPKGPFFLA